LGLYLAQIELVIANNPAYQAIVKDYGIGGKYWTMSASFTTALGAFLAVAQGGNATAGAAGALASTASAGIAEQLARLIFNSGPNGTLTEDQKQVIDNLVVIDGSVAGGGFVNIPTLKPCTF